MAGYIPARGDFVYVALDPQSGHEQKGRRPALVISHTEFNRLSGLAVVCPITNTDKGYPFHVPVMGNDKVRGFVMVEQVKSLDFNTRKVAHIAKAPDELLGEVLGLLDALVF